MGKAENISKYLIDIASFLRTSVHRKIRLGLSPVADQLLVYTYSGMLENEYYKREKVFSSTWL